MDKTKQKEIDQTKWRRDQASKEEKRSTKTTREEIDQAKQRRDGPNQSEERSCSYLAAHYHLKPAAKTPATVGIKFRNPITGVWSNGTFDLKRLS
jgi:hypothetical protein